MSKRKTIVKVCWIFLLIAVCWGLPSMDSLINAANVEWPEVKVLQESEDLSWFDDFQEIAGIERWSGSANWSTKYDENKPELIYSLAFDQGSKYSFEFVQSDLSEFSAHWEGKVQETEAFVNNQMTFKQFVALGDILAALDGKKPVPTTRLSTVKGNQVIQNEDGLTVSLSINAKEKNYQLLLPSLTVKTTEIKPDPGIPNKDNKEESDYTVLKPDIEDTRPVPGKIGTVIAESDKGQVIINQPMSAVCKGEVCWKVEPGPSGRYKTVVEITKEDLTKQAPSFSDCESINNSLALRIEGQQVTEIITHANYRVELQKDGKPVKKGEKFLRLMRVWTAKLNPKTMERNSEYSENDNYQQGFMIDTQNTGDEGQVKVDIPGVRSFERPGNQYTITLQEFVIGPDQPVPGDAAYFIVVTEMTPTKYRVRISTPETIPAKMWYALIKLRERSKNYLKPRTTEKSAAFKMNYGWQDYSQYMNMLPKE